MSDRWTLPEYFVCYSRENRDLVARIEAKLAARRKRREIEVWRDVRNLDVWAQFTPVIIDVLDRAAGAIVVVSDAWQASDYIQEHEWPRILQRHRSDSSFQIFPLAVNTLDSDDPLREHNFVNDLRDERLLDASDGVRDTVLTKLSDLIGAHARALADRSSSRATPVAVTGTVSTGRRPANVEGSGGDLRPGLHNVAELPHEFVPPAELEDLCERVRVGALTGISGLQGEGGTGKSVLASAVARRLVDDFPGGVHWVTVGDQASSEDVRGLQARLLVNLGAVVEYPPRDANQGKELLVAALASRAALVVVDDVWHPWQGRAFDVVQAGPARVLFTTRFPDALPAGTEAAEVTRLEPIEATAFLRHVAGGLPVVGEDLAKVLDTAGGLRLALAVLGATARVEESWEAVLSRLGGLAERFGRGDDASSAQKALHVAVDTLGAADRERLWTLAAFPADAAVPLLLLAELWRVTTTEATGVAHRLAEKDLASVDGELIELHDHVHNFLALETPGRPDLVHLQLWELANREAGGDWSRLARRQPYLWDRLVWHANRAGLNSARLEELGGDLSWLAERIRRQRASAAEQDLRQIADHAGLDPEAPLRRMQRVLRHGGLFDSLGDQAGLDVSLRCWAEAVGQPGRTSRLRTGSLPVPGTSLLRTLRGHASEVWGVAFDPTTGHLATASADGTARIWNPATGETITTLTADSSEVWGVAFDPTTGHLATASADGTARIWDPTTGETLTTLTAHTGGLWGVAFDPTTGHLATASADGTARIWNPATGETITTLTAHTGGLWGVAFDPTTGHLATASSDGTARIWNPATGETITTLTAHTAQAWGVAFDPTTGHLATGSADGTARIWDPTTGETLTTLPAHTSGVRGVAFDSTGLFATASADGTARIWNPATGDTLTTLAAHTSSVSAVAFDPTTGHLATASADGTARIWNPATGDTLTTLAAHTFSVSGVAFGPTTGHLATASADGTARIRNPTTGDTLTHTGEVWGVAFDPTTGHLATASVDGTARIWDPATGETLTTLTGHTSGVRSVAFDPTTGHLATASGDGTARIWHPATGETLTTLAGHTSGVWGVAFDPTTGQLATASAGTDCTARIWNPSTGKNLTTLAAHNSQVWAVAFDPTTGHLATASRDRTARIWNPATGETLTTLTGHTRSVLGVAFHPTTGEIATVSGDGTARIWNPATGETLTTLTGHTSGVWGVAFDPITGHLATASADGTARIWNLATGGCLLTLALACSGALALHGNLLAIAAGFHWAVIELPPL